MESREEEEIAKRWRIEDTARENTQQSRIEEVFESVAPKRRRIADVPEEVLEWVTEETGSTNVGVIRGKRPVGAAKGRNAAAVKGTKRKDRD